MRSHESIKVLKLLETKLRESGQPLNTRKYRDTRQRSMKRFLTTETPS